MAAVDALVALLDQIDGDADLKEDNPPEDDALVDDVGDNEASLVSVEALRSADPTARSAGRREPTTTGKSRTNTTNPAAMTSRRSAQRPQ